MQEELPFNLAQILYFQTICNSLTVNKLSADVEYEIRLWGISDNGTIYGPSNSTWINTYPLNYTPMPVRQLNVTDLKPSNDTYSAALEWKPAIDFACFYHFLFAWDGDEEYVLKEREITNIDDLFQIELNKIPFETNVTIGLMSKSMDMTRESNQTWLSFFTPSCLETYNNLVQCAPAKPENIQSQEELVNFETSTYNVFVNWTKPLLIPDYYTVFVLFNATNVSQNVSGDETFAYFAEVPLGVSYNIVVRAFSAGGESPVAIINDKLLKANIYVTPGYIPIVAGSVGVALLLIATTVILYARNKFKKSQNIDDSFTPHYSGAINKEKYFANMRLTPNDGYYKPELVNDQWCLNSEDMAVDVMIGEGAFGIVYKGFFKKSDGSTIPIAIKMLKGTSTIDEIRQFEQEIEIMKFVGSHPHLVSMLGCCLKSGYFGPLLVVEYCNKGDLQTYLRSIWYQITVQSDKTSYINGRNLNESDNNFSNKTYELFDDYILESKDLLSFGRQIALGMEYLSNLRVVHRDLAARNVLMCANRTLKIADFGLSRDVYEDNIYLKTGAGKLPVKWMAIESLTHQQYTTQSDVWSFGIVLWEIVTLGGNPYAAIHAKDLLGFLKSGYRMECPKNCSRDLYNIMLLCWKESAKERPTFLELRQMLENFLENENHYVNLDVRF